MTSKAERRRRKKEALQARTAYEGGKPPETATRPRKPTQTARPTPERQARGKWQAPTGQGSHMHPVVDLASDLIGALYQARQISTSQEQAARTFQKLRDDYLREIGTKGFTSCLADNSGGYDNGDGDPTVIAAYRGLVDRIGRVKTASLIVECDKGPEQAVSSLVALRRALDAVNS